MDAYFYGNNIVRNIKKLRNLGKAMMRYGVTNV